MESDMLLTKKIIKFKSFLIRIPRETNNLKDLAENRWGYKKVNLD